MTTLRRVLNAEIMLRTLLNVIFYVEDPPQHGRLGVLRRFLNGVFTLRTLLIVFNTLRRGPQGGGRGRRQGSVRRHRGP